MERDISICNAIIKKIGGYHDNSVHSDGNGKCLVCGCKCVEFKSYRPDNLFSNSWILFWYSLETFWANSLCAKMIVDNASL